MSTHQHKKQLIQELMLVYPALNLKKLNEPRMGVKLLQHILDCGFDGMYNLRYESFL